MKLPRIFMAGLGRAVIAAFAIQAVAVAMCLMPVDAVAGSQACAMHHVDGTAHSRHACPFCDAPQHAVPQMGIVQVAKPPVASGMAVSVAPAPAQAGRSSPVAFYTRILAPPDSVFLIHHTTRRIRI